MRSNSSSRSILLLNPPPRRGGGKRWGLERLEHLERLERMKFIRNSVFRYSISASFSLAERLVPYSCPWFPLERSFTSYFVPILCASGPWVTKPTFSGS